ncbi:MAG: hypothetical protein ACI4DK_11190 [Lachnospiraceae bacterium]
MEFDSREAMLQFENDREQYFLDWIARCNRRNLGEFYKYLFLEAFHPKYRAIKKMYEEYDGGWYRDEHGWICTKYIGNIDSSNLKDGDICVERDDNAIYNFYVFHEGINYKLDLTLYKDLLK